MLIVSHDRYFINRLANKIYRITKDGSKEFLGDYDYYIQNNIEEAVKVVKEKNLSYKQKKEQEAVFRKKNNRIKKLEEEIATNEEKIKELESLAISEEYATDYVKVTEMTAEIEYFKTKNEELYEEWLALN